MLYILVQLLHTLDVGLQYAGEQGDSIRNRGKMGDDTSELVAREYWRAKSVAPEGILWRKSHQRPKARPPQ
jgi:hypothetical protein